MTLEGPTPLGKYLQMAETATLAMQQWSSRKVSIAIFFLVHFKFEPIDVVLFDVDYSSVVDVNVVV